MRRIASALLIVGALTCKDSTGPVVVDRVVVTGPAALYVGQMGQYTATALDSRGDTLRSRRFDWSASDSTVASVTGSGLVTTHAVGAVTITATADAKLGIASLAVRLVPVVRVDVIPTNTDSLYVGDSLQLAATPRDSAGDALARAVTWSTSDTSKAAVSPTGLVRTRAPGSFTVTATSESRTGGVFLNAHLRPVLLSMPDSFSIGLRHAVRLIPDLESASGTHLSSRLVTWSSSNADILLVDQYGVLRPQNLGTATITARAANLVDSSVVRIIPEPVAFIVVSYIASIPLADTTLEAFLAQAYDSASLPTVGDSIVWSSTDTSVVTIRSSPANAWRATARGRRPGITRITAASGAVTGTLDYTLQYPLAHLVAQPDSLMLGIGEQRVLAGAGTDRFGNRLDISSYGQSVTSADSTVARVASNAPAFIAGQRAGRTLIYFSLSNGLADTVPIIVSPASAPRLKWQSDFLSAYPYSQVKTSLVSADSNGAVSSVPRDVHVESTDTTVAIPVDSSINGLVGAESIRVEIRKAGFATLTARGDSQFASLFVTVSDIPVARVELDSTPRVLHVGDSLQLHATVRGNDGIVRPYPIAWTSSDERRALVSASGLVRPAGIGDVAIIAASGSVRDTAVLTILSATPPTVTGVSTTPLVPGAIVTMSGTGFDPNPAANSVLIDSVPATITAASDTTLTLTLPPANQWPCTATHMARLVIGSGARLGLDSVLLQVAVQRPALALGQAVTMAGADARCNELAPVHAQTLYVLSVANSDQSMDISFNLRGETLRSGPSSIRPDTSSPGTATQPLGTAFSWDSLRRAATLHRRLLDQSKALAQRAGPPAPLLRAARQQMPQRSVTTTINGIARVRIPRLEDPDFCASYQSIDANVVYVGTHVVILEDRAAPLVGALTAEYQALGMEFDNVMYPMLLANFGDPLALDSLLDRDGRIAMVFSPQVNRYGVSGFVVSCDFYPEATAPSSNTGEIFYAQVPTAAGGGFGAYTVDVWRWLIRSVVMHESKHLAAYAERLSRGAPPEETWLEESSAVLAEELWSRRIYGTTWRGEASYRSTLYCDVRPSFPECTGRPYSMFNAFAFLYDYITQLEKRTPLGPTAANDATFYGSGWSLLRWTIDHYAVSESDFLRSLVADPTTGVANLTARAQRPFDELLSDWSDALYHDSWGLSPGNPLWNIPSWNVADILTGMHADFPVDFPDPRPLRGRGWDLTSGFAFSSANVPPGGWSLFVGDGLSAAPQLFDLHLIGSAPPPPSLRVQLVRVR